MARQVDADTASSISSPDVTTETVPSYNFLYIALSPGATGMRDVLTPKVREAIALAIDYDGMIDFTTGGNEEPQAPPIPNGFPGTASLTPRTQDVERARPCWKRRATATDSRWSRAIRTTTSMASTST